MIQQSILEAVRQGAIRLRDAGIETPDLDAEVLMRNLLNLSRDRYFLHRNEPIAESTLAEFDAQIQHRIDRVSVAYIVGVREFMGLEFRVGPGVLVPRPETELLVLWAMNWLEEREKIGANVVDVGTGSGAIVLSLCHLTDYPRIGEIFAVDSSPEALAWARENLATLGSNNHPIEFVLGNLLDRIEPPIDLVLANLPYLTTAQVDSNPDLASEPREALVSGAEGLDLIRELLADIPRVLTSSGAAVLEIDPSQATTLLKEATNLFPEARVAINRDLAGHDRFLIVDRGDASDTPVFDPVPIISPHRS